MNALWGRPAPPYPAATSTTIGGIVTLSTVTDTACEVVAFPAPSVDSAVML
jgi:hypothetical protein